MLFPRYIHRDARDFFYLTARTVLPGAPITGAGAADAPADGEGGTWRVKGLPQHGYPYAVAITSVRLGAEATDKRVRVLRVDPRTVRAEAGAGSAPSAGTDADAGRQRRLRGARRRLRRAPHVRPPGQRRPTAIDEVPRAHDAGERPDADGRKLWLGPHVFAIEKTAPRAATAHRRRHPARRPRRGRRSRGRRHLRRGRHAPVGRAHARGQARRGDVRANAEAPRAPRLLVARPRRRPTFARSSVGALDIGGQPAASRPRPSRGSSARPRRAPAPYFESTQVVPQSVWFPLQQQRVKWRPTLAPPDKPAASGSAASPAPAPAPK